jgi:uncharacterized protein
MCYLKSEFSLDWAGIHGAPHWGRVMRNGFLLQEREGGRRDIIKLFALLHDHWRIHEGSDHDHGLRAAESALTIRGELFDNDLEGFSALITALKGHSDGRLGKRESAIVRVCWDADRLDLGRVGIRPDPRLLCTSSAKDAVFLESAYQRSISGTLF